MDVVPTEICLVAWILMLFLNYNFIIFFITSPFKLFQGSLLSLSDSVVMIVPKVLRFLDLYTFKCLISSRLNGLSRLMVLKGPEGLVQWNLRDSNNLNRTMSSGGSIDALNGWRIGSFPQALQLLASMGIHFFFSWVIWPCLILRNQSPILFS